MKNHLFIKKTVISGASGNTSESSVYGGIDGAVTNFCGSSGSFGANLDSGIIITFRICHPIWQNGSRYVCEGCSTWLRKVKRIITKTPRSKYWEVENLPDVLSGHEIKESIQQKDSKAILEKVVDQICSDEWCLGSWKWWKIELNMMEEKPKVPFECLGYFDLVHLWIGFIPLTVYLWVFFQWSSLWNIFFGPVYWLE